ncbi:MAG TPA: hypothetical protein VM901_01095 [Bdellovibrionota bacterium]|jgi:hypothetical protein|nr:hypothetical protein [Bdellovibrionota bacterium]
MKWISRHSVILFLSSLLSLTAVAAPSTEEFYRGPQNAFAILHLSEGVLTLDEFRIARDGWQDRERTQNFESYEQAQKYLHTKYTRSNAPAVAAQSRPLIAPPMDAAAEPLWKATREWDSHWELEFSKWIVANVDENFFVKHQIATDCADVAYVLRWVFARLHSLPAANRLAGSGQLLTNQHMRSEWSRLPTHPDWAKDRRLRAALDYIMNNTYTHTLLRDSYPVAITTEAFSAGSYHVVIRGTTGHTQYIYRSSGNAFGLPFMLFSSTVPRAIRKVSAHFYWGEQPTDPKTSGFVRMRWPQSGSLREASTHPWFSLDQYSKDFFGSEKNFGLALVKKLDPSFDVVKVAGQIVSDIKAQILERVNVVAEGYAFCKSNPCPPGSKNYDDWSTPSRDGRIAEHLGNSDAILSLCNKCGDLVKNFHQETFNVEGESVSMLAAAAIFRRNLYSSDPKDPPQIRWGLDPSISARKIAEALKPFLERRAERVQKSAVSASLDNTIGSLVKGTTDSFSMWGETFRQHFYRSLRETPVQIPTVPLQNYEEVFENFAFWSSSAKDAHARWATKDSYKHRVFTPGSRQILSDTHFLLDLNSGQMKHFDNGQSLTPPTPFHRWTTLSLDGNWAILDGTHLAKMSAPERAEMTWAFPESLAPGSTPVFIEANDPYFLVAIGTELRLYHRQNAALELIDSLKPQNLALVLKNAHTSRLMRDEQNELYVFDSHRPHLGFEKVDARFRNYAALYDTGSHLIFYNCELECDDVEVPPLAYEKTNGKVTQWTKGVYQPLRANLWQRQYGDVHEFLSFDNEFHVTDRMVFDGLPFSTSMLQHPGYYVTSYGEPDFSKLETVFVKVNAENRLEALQKIPGVFYTGQMANESIILNRPGSMGVINATSALWRMKGERFVESQPLSPNFHFAPSPKSNLTIGNEFNQHPEGIDVLSTLNCPGHNNPILALTGISSDQASFNTNGFASNQLGSFDHDSAAQLFSRYGVHLAKHGYKFWLPNDICTPQNPKAAAVEKRARALYKNPRGK